MSITKELREWVKSLYTPNSDQLKSEACRIADRIDAEYEKVVAERDEYLDSCHLWDFKCSTMVELPRDADGEPWRLGDELMMEGEVCEVVGIGGKTIFYAFGDGVEWTIAHNNRHHHAPTVEDVLEKALNEAAMLDRQEGYWPSAADITNIVNSLASKLQLREDA